MNDLNTVDSGIKSKDRQVAVIILNHNNIDDTLACIESVLHFTYPAFRILVVDNGSTDGSFDAISRAYPNIDVIRSDVNLGAPGGRNFGLQHVLDQGDQDYVLFLDNDTIVEPELLSQLVAALENDTAAGIACPKTYREFPSTTIMSCGMQVNLFWASIYDIGAGKPDRGQYDQQRYVPACGAFGFLIRAGLLEEMDGFDDRFNPYGWGEIDLCLRARTLGVRTLYVPLAILYHKGGKGGRGPVPARELYKARNYLRLLDTHASLWQWLGNLIVLPFKVLPRLVVYIIRGNGAVVVAQFKGMIAWLRNR